MRSRAIALLSCLRAPSSHLQPCSSRLTSTGTAQPSPDHEEGPASDGQIDREQILQRALEFVPQDGWTAAALERAAVSLGYSASAAGLVDRAEGGLVEHFVGRCNHELSARLEALGDEYRRLPVRERIRVAVRERLGMIGPYVESWPQAMAIQAYPSNAPSSTSLLCGMVDDIWVKAGDTSDDYNWYTKRALLASVYVSSELYMITDGSPDFEDTYAALDRRIEEVLAAGKTMRGAAAFLDPVLGALRGFAAGKGSNLRKAFGEALISKLPWAQQSIPHIELVDPLEALILGQQLGEGGFARVLRASDAVTPQEKKCVLKVWKPVLGEPGNYPSLTLFLREAELTHAAASKYVVKLLGIGFLPESLSRGVTTGSKIRKSMAAGLQKVGQQLGISNARMPEAGVPPDLGSRPAEDILREAYARGLCFFQQLEFCEGNSIKLLILRQLTQPGVSLFSWEARMRWAKQVAEGMAHLESAKIYHRDVKLDNILLDHEDPEKANAKIADLGLARTIGPGSNARGMGHQFLKRILSRYIDMADNPITLEIAQEGRPSSGEGYAVAAARMMNANGGQAQPDGVSGSPRPPAANNGGAVAGSVYRLSDTPSDGAGPPSGNGSVRGTNLAARALNGIGGSIRRGMLLKKGGGGSQTALAAAADNGASEAMNLTDGGPGSANVGTVLYQAPEILRGSRGGFKSDVFSFSIMFYELWIALPFSVKYQNEQQVSDHAKRIMNQWRPPLNEKWPADLRQIFERCWTEREQDRPTFAELAIMLDQQSAAIVQHMKNLSRPSCCTIM